MPSPKTSQRCASPRSYNVCHGTDLHHRRGGNVAVLDVRDTPLEPVHDLPEQYGIKTEYIQCNVSNEDSLRAAFDKANGGTDKPFVNQKWEEVNNILQINAMGSFFAAQMAVDQMQKQGTPGSVVFIASITAHVNLPGYRMAG
nr:putative oxidoreductase yohf [Quercus suber]